MSLREQIERRRMAESANGNAAPVKSGKTQMRAQDDSPPESFLRLTKLDKQCWVLPWSSFHGAGFAPGNETSKHERLHLVFAHHEVTVRGHNLAGVIDAIEEENLHDLCETAGEYNGVSNPENSTLVILAVEINVRTQ